MRNALWRFTDIVLDNLTFSTDEDDDDRFEMPREVVIFLTAFLLDPPAESYAEEENITLTQTNLLVDEAASLICDMLCLVNIEEKKILLHDIQERIERAKTELKPPHDEIPGLSWNNVPQTNRRGFFDFLLRNLEKKLEAQANLFPFEKHLIAVVQKELVSLKPFLMNIFELQEEHEELKDIWFRAGNVAYLVDHVTDSCLSFDIPIWSNLMHLSKATEQIQSVKTEAGKIEKSQMYTKRFSSAKINSRVMILPEEGQATLKTEIVGFKDEKKSTIDWLIGGTDELDIVAIVGMGGQGKTTLAERVFDDPQVQIHFKMQAKCCISQVYDIKEILLGILGHVGSSVPKEEVSSVSHHDLANRLYKRLKGRRYLIFLDDIWDIKAWKELRLSFPNDENGSRILLTSRNRNVALEAKHDCCIVDLHPLSSEESWNLLQLKLLEEGDGCPEILSNIGKKIANHCKGLPLAIVLVAGLLKKDKNVDSWEKIAESLQSQIASKGYMEILELSYNHLPDFLKPCFLYLAAFKEDEAIYAKKLIQLWIAEGFVQSDGKKSSEAIASDYLVHLIDRSLVSITERSSKYGVKNCGVHDVLHEFCLIKAKEERFLQVTNSSDHSSGIRYDPYRICYNDNYVPFVDSKPNVWSVRSLLFSFSGEEQFSFDGALLFSRFKLLRVLNLERTVSCSDFHKITQLVHLRFLLVFNGCEHLPESIVNLLRLEVLWVRNSHYKRGNLPSIVMKMSNLRHIMMGKNYNFFGTGYDDDDVRPLEFLETLTFIRFWDEEIFDKVARRLPNVRKLGVEVDFGIRLSSYFNKLESLKIEVRDNFSGFTYDFPSTLKKLSFEHRYEPLPESTLPLIAKLSNLEVFKLSARFKHRRWDVKDDEFLRVRYLKISSNIREWNVSEGSFPCLEQLILVECTRLKELPSRFGEISSLRRINVIGGHKDVSSSFQQIVEDQKDAGNEGLQYSISYASQGNYLYESHFSIHSY